MLSAPGLRPFRRMRRKGATRTVAIHGSLPAGSGERRPDMAARAQALHP